MSSSSPAESTSTAPGNAPETQSTYKLYSRDHQKNISDFEPPWELYLPNPEAPGNGMLELKILARVNSRQGDGSNHVYCFLESDPMDLVVEAFPKGPKNPPPPSPGYRHVATACYYRDYRDDYEQGETRSKIKGFIVVHISSERPCIDREVTMADQLRQGYFTNFIHTAYDTPEETPDMKQGDDVVMHLDEKKNHALVAVVQRLTPANGPLADFKATVEGLEEGRRLDCSSQSVGGQAIIGYSASPSEAITNWGHTRTLVP
ncbi:hypothetical protein F4780DRAFT_25627 [Xylariomycetidae sp. FL0641]|nr:hypothetical protein F4780DRAFT_25627 [Xylariomycetidae sp. FL0641]